MQGISYLNIEDKPKKEASKQNSTKHVSFTSYRAKKKSLSSSKEES